MYLVDQSLRLFLCSIFPFFLSFSLSHTIILSDKMKINSFFFLYHFDLQSLVLFIWLKNNFPSDLLRIDGNVQWKRWNNSKQANSRETIKYLFSIFFFISSKMKNKMWIKTKIVIQTLILLNYEETFVTKTISWVKQYKRKTFQCINK